MTTPKQGERLWRRLVAADNRYDVARMDLYRVQSELLKSNIDIVAIIQRALETVTDRGAALRLLLELDEPVRREMFSRLVELASVGHRDIQLVRDVILSLDRDWTLEHIPDQIGKVLEQAPPSESYEEYRRLAELLDMLHSPYLAALVQKAGQSNDIDIREVAEDFADRA
jgi:hypothetical protein